MIEPKTKLEIEDRFRRAVLEDVGFVLGATLGALLGHLAKRRLIDGKLWALSLKQFAAKRREALPDAEHPLGPLRLDVRVVEEIAGKMGGG